MNNQNISTSFGDVFISCLNSDRDLVKPLAEELKRLGISCFYVENDDISGNSYAQTVVQAISACKIFLLIWTENAKDSDNVVNETTLAIRFKKRIIPYKIGYFNADRNAALMYHLAPLSWCEVPQQTPKTDAEVIGLILNALLNNVDAFLLDILNQTPGFADVNAAYPAEDVSNKLTSMGKYKLGWKTQKLCQRAQELWNARFGETAQLDSSVPRVPELECPPEIPPEIPSQEPPEIPDSLSNDENSLKSQNCSMNERDVPQNPEEAFNCYLKQAEQGDDVAQNSLGDCYFNGCGVPQNLEEAFKWYLKAAEHGNAISQNSLGDCYFNGLGVPQNLGEAIKWYRKAAEQGHAIAQYSLGQCCLNGIGVPQDQSEAIKWLQLSADQGYALAQDFMGNCNFYGYCVPQNYPMALMWFNLAAKQGYVKSQITLGNCYCYGNGAPRNSEEAVKWYSLAVQQGDAVAQTAFGDFFSNEENYDEAMKWYTLAAQQGYNVAQYKLGLYYYDNSEGNSEKDALAVNWLQKAADQGNADAQELLGECYFYGEIVPRNCDLAYELLSKAASQGHEEAIAFLKNEF